MDDDQVVLVRVLTGHVGDLAPDSGSIIKLPADVAAELVQAGEAVAVQAGEGGQIFRTSDRDTAPTLGSCAVRI